MYSYNVGQYVDFTMGRASQAKLIELKSEVGATNMSQACRNAMGDFLDDARRGLPYTGPVLDSYGRVPSPMMRGEVIWLGAYDQCLETVGENFQPAYCTSLLEPESNLDTDAGFLMGLCVDDACSTEDVTIYTNILADNLMSGLNATYSECPNAREWTPFDIIMLIWIAITVVLCLAGTIMDLVRRHQMRGSLLTTEGDSYPGTSQTSPEKEKQLIEDQSYTTRFFLAFSWLSNAERLFDTSLRPGTLECLSGIRFLSMAWIILGHGYYRDLSGFAVVNPDDLYGVLEKFLGQIIVSFTLAVDTFLVLSGILVCYLTLKLAKKGDIQWGYFYFHRLWRLTPVYMFLLLFWMSLFLHLPHGPLMRKQDYIETECIHYGATNLFYVNNLFHTNTRADHCMGWTWYLAMDMQYYLLSPIIIILFYRKPKVGFAIGGLGICCSVIITLGLVLSGKFYQLTPDYNNFELVLTYYGPYCRVSPYIVGLFMGYLLSRQECKSYLNKKRAVIGWCLSTALALAVLYAQWPWYLAGRQMPLQLGAVYVAFSRLAFALAVAWVIFACVLGYGGYVNSFLGWPFWLPLSRLTYCSYLIHPMLVLFYGLNQRYRFYVSAWSMTYLFLGHVVMTTLFAIVTALSVEFPIMALEKVLFPCFSRKPAAASAGRSYGTLMTTPSPEAEQ